MSLSRYIMNSSIRRNCKLQTQFDITDNSIDNQDGTCKIIEISSDGEALERVNKNKFNHDWLGKYYNVGWQSNQTEVKHTYRRIGKLLERFTRFNPASRRDELALDYYYVGLSYSEDLGYWRVNIKPIMDSNIF